MKFPALPITITSNAGGSNIGKIPHPYDPEPFDAFAAQYTLNRYDDVAYIVKESGIVDLV